MMMMSRWIWVRDEDYLVCSYIIRYTLYKKNLKRNDWNAVCIVFRIVSDMLHSIHLLVCCCDVNNNGGLLLSGLLRYQVCTLYYACVANFSSTTSIMRRSSGTFLGSRLNFKESFSASSHNTQHIITTPQHLLNIEHSIQSDQYNLINSIEHHWTPSSTTSSST